MTMQDTTTATPAVAPGEKASTIDLTAGALWAGVVHGSALALQRAATHDEARWVALVATKTHLLIGADYTGGLAAGESTGFRYLVPVQTAVYSDTEGAWWVDVHALRIGLRRFTSGPAARQEAIVPPDTPVRLHLTRGARDASAFLRLSTRTPSYREVDVRHGPDRLGLRALLAAHHAGSRRPDGAGAPAAGEGRLWTVGVDAGLGLVAPTGEPVAHRPRRERVA